MNPEPSRREDMPEQAVPDHDMPERDIPAQPAGQADVPEDPRPAGTEQSNGQGNGQVGELLFTEQDVRSFRSRWQDLQGQFVDDPRGAVEAADALVNQMTQSLNSRFAENRSRLETQWSSGQDVDTEELRLALRRYHALFDRLLAA